jgi:hypothetical protein
MTYSGIGETYNLALNKKEFEDGKCSGLIVPAVKGISGDCSHSQISTNEELLCEQSGTLDEYDTLKGPP